VRGRTLEWNIPIMHPQPQSAHRAQTYGENKVGVDEISAAQRCCKSRYERRWRSRNTTRSMRGRISEWDISMMHPQPQSAPGSQIYGENNVDKPATASIKAATEVSAEKMAISRPGPSVSVIFTKFVSRTTRRKGQDATKYQGNS